PARLDTAPPPDALRPSGPDGVSLAHGLRADRGCPEDDGDGTSAGESRAAARLGPPRGGLLRDRSGSSPDANRRSASGGSQEAVVGPDRRAEGVTVARRARRGRPELPWVFRGPVELPATTHDRLPPRRCLHGGPGGAPALATRARSALRTRFVHPQGQCLEGQLPRWPSLASLH